MRAFVKSVLVLALSVVFGCGGGDGGGADTTPQPRDREEKAAAERVRDEAFVILQQQYLFPERLPRTPERFADAGELVRSLGDPFTVHLSAAAIASVSAGLEGRVSGIGVVVALERGMDRFVITEVLPNSPAVQAGLMVGDEIVEIDGNAVRGFTLEEVVARIRGPSGTQVSLTLLRGRQFLSTRITRQVFEITSITTTLLDNTFGYVKQTMFTSRSTGELLIALQTVKATGARGIILDLRGNPGGLVAASIEEADQFIADQRPPGTVTDLLGCTTADLPQVLVRIFGRVGQEAVCVADDFNFSTGQPYSVAERSVDLPLVILVDGRTASAAELLTAALRENGAFPRVAVVGTRTFGKGLIQRIQTLSDGSGLIFVTLEFRTPRGNRITATGLPPDIEVTDDLTTPADEPLERAKRHLGPETLGVMR